MRALCPVSDETVNTLLAKVEGIQKNTSSYKKTDTANMHTS